jgi:2-polyprenyl-3-methyl-5-hydroxy-6-metoxy-1,4-benzoquinol methylase
VRAAISVAGLQLKWHELHAPDLADGSAGAVAFGLWVPEDPDTLLDQITEQEYFENDERMPYFGTIWPSAESLVAQLLAGPRLDDARVLDLGCGLGVCGFAAASRGAHVTFMDWEPRALKIVAASALAQELPLARFDLVAADWRKPPTLAPFDRILGADVLYEQRNAPAVAAFVAAHLAPGGEAWITDPKRPHAVSFPALAQAAGLEFLGNTLLPPMAHHREIALLRVRRPGG